MNSMLRNTDPARRVSADVRSFEAGKTLIELLSVRFTYQDANAWTRMIDRGRVFVNGRPTGAESVLRIGDRLVCDMGDLPEPVVDMNWRMLYEDAALMVIDKPGNLPCHPGGRYFRHTLWSALKQRMPIESARFVHRLDRETSGVVVIAKTRADAAACHEAWGSGRVRKRYASIVEGDEFPEALEAIGRMVPDGNGPVRKKQRFTRFSEEGLACATRFFGIGAENGMSLVMALPETGRTHQIRVTLWSLGYPVVGDKLYGIDDTLFLRFIADRLSDSDVARLRIARQALHAAELVFPHPRTGRIMRFRAPLPAVLCGLVPQAARIWEAREA